MVNLPSPAMRERGYSMPHSAPQAVAVAQQPVERDQRVAALDLAGIEHRFDLGQGLDDDADVLVLLGEAVDAGGVASN